MKDFKFTKIGKYIKVSKEGSSITYYYDRKTIFKFNGNDIVKWSNMSMEQFKTLFIKNAIAS